MAGEKPERPPLLRSEFGEALMARGEDRERKLQEAVGKLQAEMEAASARIRDLVLAQPPTGLLGYLWSQFFMGALTHHKEHGGDKGPDTLSNNFNLFLSTCMRFGAVTRACLPKAN